MAQRGAGAALEDSEAPLDRDRWWELSFSIRSFENVTPENLNVFFSMSIVSDEESQCCVHLRTKFTKIFFLEKGHPFIPDFPMSVYSEKKFRLTYNDLERHAVKVDMWRVSCWTFNEYYGSKKEKLSKIASHDPHMDFLLSRRLSKRLLNQNPKRDGRLAGDVARFRCTVQLEEIFDFEVTCNNFALELNRKHPDYRQLKIERKRLSFAVPKDGRSLPGQRRFLGAGLTSRTVSWNAEQGRFFWAHCGRYSFRGTRTELRNSYFILSVLTGSPPLCLPCNAAISAVEHLVHVQACRVLGRCLMNLTSVLDISVLQGPVKKFTQDFSQYLVGTLSGSVKCVLRPIGRREAEADFRGTRPEQVRTAISVTHLKCSERHLVVHVRKCESLPLGTCGDSDRDPFVKVSWDNMVLVTPSIRSLRPVFNHSFYFPVRLCPELRMASKYERKYQETILKYELTSKGCINFEVWSDDASSPEFLGGISLALSELLRSSVSEQRSLLGQVKQAAGMQDDCEEEDRQWYRQAKTVRVFDGATALCGGPGRSGSAKIFFEAYFYPDWADTLHLDESQEVENFVLSAWAQREQEWNSSSAKFLREYAFWFPDAIAARKCIEDSDRIFPSMALHPRCRRPCPLMSFVSPIIVPEVLSSPASLLCWVHSISFEASARQTRSGKIDRDSWKDSEQIAARRCGSVQDHAVLLCSLLLGCKKDAYVCKGTVFSGEREKEELIEHAWVMTRESGWVTFWEASSRQLFHLPNRYDEKLAARQRRQQGTSQNCNRQAQRASDQNTTERETARHCASEEKEESGLGMRETDEDAKRTEDSDMLTIPIVGRTKAEAKRKVTSRDRQAEMKREALAIAPRKTMLQDGNLVTCLPYDSIDVVFNDVNLYANRQNHHPACILYDFVESFWEPLLQEGCPQAEDLRVVPLVPNLRLQPERGSREDQREDLRSELMQTVQFHRSKRGKDTLFDTNAELRSQLQLFLEIQELWRTVDPDSPAVGRHLNTAPGTTMPSAVDSFISEIIDVRRWNAHGSPYFSENSAYADYQKEQRELWKMFHDKCADFLRREGSFPTKRGKTFKGFPVHFNTADNEAVRSLHLQLEAFQEVVNIEEEDVYFTIEVMTFPLLGGIVSVWVFVGLHAPTQEQERTLSSF